jgi:hypothetical protein
MIKALVAGFWTCAVVLLSMYGVNYLGVGHGGASATAAAAAPAPNATKIPAIDVPMIANGELQGYIIAQFSYVLNPKPPAGVSVSPDPFLRDEAFREIYSNPTLDFMHIEKVDLAKLTKDLAQNVNTRLGGNVLQDVLVDDFNYVSKEDMSK